MFGANFDSCPVSGSSNLLNSAAIYNTLTGYTTSSKNYKINIDSNGYAYVNVPWAKYYHKLRYEVSYSSYSTAAISGTYSRILSGYDYGCVYHITGQGTSSSAIIYVNTSTSSSVNITAVHQTIAIAQNSALTYPYLTLTVFVPATYSYKLYAKYVNNVCVDANILSRYSA